MRKSREEFQKKTEKRENKRMRRGKEKTDHRSKAGKRKPSPTSYHYHRANGEKTDGKLFSLLAILV